MDNQTEIDEFILKAEEFNKLLLNFNIPIEDKHLTIFDRVRKKAKKLRDGEKAKPGELDDLTEKITYYTDYYYSRPF